MTKKSELLDAYTAGKKSVNHKPYSMGLGAFFGVIIGRIVERRYMIPSFESFAISILIVVLLAVLFGFIETRLRRESWQKKN